MVRDSLTTFFCGRCDRRLDGRPSSDDLVQVRVLPKLNDPKKYQSAIWILPDVAPAP